MLLEALVKTVFRYAHAIEVRFFQFYELCLLHDEGVNFGIGFFWRIIRRPAGTEDWINLARFLKPNERVTVLDIGANIGDFTVDFLSVYKNGRSVCFEPVQSTFNQLNLKLSGDGRVQTHRCALSDFNGIANIHVHGTSTLSTLGKYTPDAQTFYRSEDQYSEETPCRTLDSFEFRKDPDRLFIKIDVQGFEVEVLRGASDVLALADAVLLECSFGEEWVQKEPSFAQCCSMLRNAGLFPIVFQDFGRARSNYAFERDVLFVRRELLANIWLRDCVVQEVIEKGESTWPAR